MPTIDVSGEQRAFLRALRDQLQEEVQYGSVREEDALQYLIDHFEGGGELDIDADIEVSDEAIEAAKQEDSATADGGSVTEPSSAAGSGHPEPAVATGTDGTGGGAEQGSTNASGSGSSATDDGGEDRLNAMMNLLDTHADKWGEADKQDARYEVELPDGTTEYVQTKDDVRAHIFKNYD